MTLPSREQRGSGPIGHSSNACLAGTVGATEKCSLCFDPVSQNLAPAVVAHWSQLVCGALEAVKRMGLPRGDYLKGQVVLVAAHFTSSH